MTQSTSSDNFVLKSPPDWPQFWRMLQTETTGVNNTWRYIDPDILATTPFPVQPATVQVSNINPNAAAVTDLTQAELTRYERLRKLFDSMNNEYTREIAPLVKLQEWILKHVSPHYQFLCCGPGLTLKGWITALRAECQEGAHQEFQRHRDEYRAVVAQLTNKKAQGGNFKWLEWVRRWQEKFAEAHQVGVTEVRQPKDWYYDLKTPLSSLSMTEAWMTTFNAIHEPQVVDGTLTYITFANSLNSHLYAKQAAPRVKGGPGHGSFMTDPRHDPSDSDNPSPPNNKGKGKGRQNQENKPKNKGNRPNKRQQRDEDQHNQGKDNRQANKRPKRTKSTPDKQRQEHPSASTAPTKGDRWTEQCPLCRRSIHPAWKCFYLAPHGITEPFDWFTPNAEVQKDVNRILRENAGLRQKIEKEAGTKIEL